MSGIAESQRIFFEIFKGQLNYEFTLIVNTMLIESFQFHH
jgi:hypothetical protein